VPEPLKSFFSPQLVADIGAALKGAWQEFDLPRFVALATDGLDALELKQRGVQIARAMRATLPADYADAIGIVVRSFGPETRASTIDGAGMTPFYYMPHSEFIAAYGLGHFDASMSACYEITKRFTAEFCVRPYIDSDPGRAFVWLERWAQDPNAHVRRLVSEGSRPRLPWGARMKLSATNPVWALPLLELLRDDPELYVRRSVANHLNDIGKEAPDVLIETVRRWSIEPTPERDWLIKHALRHAIKQGSSAALGVLGFGEKASVAIDNVVLDPQTVAIGSNLRLRVDIRNVSKKPASLAIDVVVDFVKSGGKASPKVFKGTTAVLAPGQSVTLRSTVSFKVHTTRKPNPGRHKVALLVNGERHDIGAVDVVGASG
jgi:3-methyladenine DNA glycosylase AlkC